MTRLHDTNCRNTCKASSATAAPTSIFATVDLRVFGCRACSGRRNSWRPISAPVAISGHATLQEVERYTRAADQARLARNAMVRTMATGS
jgi:hypothetical protein